MPIPSMCKTTLHFYRLRLSYKGKRKQGYDMTANAVIRLLECYCGSGKYQILCCGVKKESK